jgi:hypothetical protein
LNVGAGVTTFKFLAEHSLVMKDENVEMKKQDVIEAIKEHRKDPKYVRAVRAFIKATS